MRSLLSTKEQRQLRLLEILIQKRDWIRLNELAQTLECTERILKNDLKRNYEQHSQHSEFNLLSMALC